MNRISFRGIALILGLALLAPVLPLFGTPADAAGPSLVLSILEEGGTYSETIRISGMVVPSPDEGQGDNRVDTLSWSVPELGDSGYIMFHRSGKFSRSIPVGDVRIPLTLILILTDRAGRRDIKTVRFTYAPEEVKPVEEPSPPEVPLPENPVVIESPRDGDVYRSVVNVFGQAAGTPTRMSWTAVELGAQGPIEIGDDGSFEFAFSTAGFSEHLTVRVIAEYPGREESASITLTNARIGPYLGVDAPKDGGFYGDELEVSGVVGRDPSGEDGMADLSGLYWWFGDEAEQRRPIFFNQDGKFSFLADLSEKSGSVVLHLEAEDLNDNKTERVFHLEDGRLPPALTIQFPLDGTEYGEAGLIASGSVIDPYASARDYGGIEALTWVFRSTNPRWEGTEAAGEISAGSDGVFEFPMIPEGVEGNAELSIVALGANGESMRVSVPMISGEGPIPSFSSVGSDESARLTWDRVPGTVEYVVSVAGDGGEIQSTRLSGDAEESIIGGLTNGNRYTFTLTANTPRGAFVSREVDAIPLSGDTLKPAADGGFRQVRLSWTPIPGADSYTVFRSAGESRPLIHLVEDVSGSVFVDETARYGVDYGYAVAPSDFPQQVSNTTPAGTLEAPEQKLEEVARYEGLVPRDLDIIGDYAFVAAGNNGLRIIDVSNPIKPVVVGEAEAGDARGVAVRGDYVYLADGERGLQVVNITAPVSPISLGSRLAGQPAGVAVRGEYAYVADADRGLRVYDVSSAREPRRVNILEGFTALGMTLVGRTALIPAGANGLVLVDLERPESPRLQAQLDLGDIRRVAVEDDLACVSDSQGNLTLIDISDPSAPSVLSNIPGANAGYLEIRNGYVFVSSISGGLSVYDARNPREPRFFESSALGDLGSLAFKTDYLYAGTPSGIMVIQTYLVGESYAVSGWSTSGRSHGVSLYGGELSVADHEGGARLYKTDGETTQSIKFPFVRDVVISDLVLALADDVAGIELFTRSDPDTPWVESDMNIPTPRASDVSISSTQVVGVSPETGLYVWNRTPEGLLSEALEIPFPGARLSASGLDVLAAADESEIRIYNSSGSETARIPLSGVKGLDISGKTLFAVGDFGMILYDITEPQTPIRAGLFPSPYARNVSVSGDFAYLSAGPDGLKVVNVHDPYRPFLSSRCPDVFAVDAVPGEDGRSAYVVDTEGVRTIDIIIPAWLR